MGDTEPLDVGAVARQPNKVKGTRLSIEWTPDDCLSSVTPNVHYYDDGDDLITWPVHVSDGIIGPAMKRVYLEAKAVADAAGKTPEDPDYPKQGDPQVPWAQIKAAAEAGTLTAVNLVRQMAQADWGRDLLRRAWARTG